MGCQGALEAGICSFMIILMERIIENNLDLQMCGNTEVSQCSLRPKQPFSQGK